ncbi:hypothetical protein BBO99_00003020 [Phytophthora kernoviae]|uniref:Thaumatin-like protein n=2 Tax=Phytophthora kernoviae TaxID=325452 RepID=A0A3R7JSJ1_9STRA|nr:hypothetical protein G195_003481 [Phytophthora kernoviae 00238/432]KAG2528608.1 hypothetical protein JM16_002657 [Phytophthora kernoviae]KAG2529072.1 hypothetical protein JM18_002566 [Phytophthora kernoviae]RLN10129.1 hypothetical protein BBI17_003084 [Phytophthora kernoviae]RLN82303.1 hypothetical protein BBO99_00003020 [Phytophthora kernoviae]
MQVFTTFMLSLAMVQATPLNIYNQCSESIQLYDNSATETVASGGSTTRTLSAGFSGMFRNGVGSQATLAEFSIIGGYTWYDISIIPTGTTGPGTCSSLENCKAVTGGTGFNTAMQIAPSGCATVTCMEDGCADAYQYPSDDAKTHSCADTATINLIFCPGGTTTTTIALTSAPATAAPTPTPTTQAPTAAPTAAPTPVPTTQVPTAAPTSVPTTQAPTPVPTTEPPIPVPSTVTPEPTAANRSLKPVTETSESMTDSASSSFLVGSYNSSSSSSVDKVSAEDATIVVSPETKTTTAPTTSGGSGADETISTKTQSSATSLSSVLVGIVGAIVVVAAIIAVVVMRRKKRQLDAMEPKESVTGSVYSYVSMLTPRSDINVLNT